MQGCHPEIMKELGHLLTSYKEYSSKLGHLTFVLTFPILAVYQRGALSMGTFVWKVSHILSYYSCHKQI